MAARSPFLGAAVALIVGLGGCGDDDGGDQDAFCADLRANLAAVVDPTISDAADADAHVSLLRDLAGKAPLAVEADWGAIVLAHETANAVVAGDDESEQLAAGAAYAMERSAIAVKAWVQRNCGFDMGPLVTVSDVPPPTTSPSSVAPSASTSTTAAP